MALAIGVVWLALGLYAVVSWLQFRNYINLLPTSAGNWKVRRQRTGLVAGGVVALGVGFWQLFAFFGR